MYIYVCVYIATCTFLSPGSLWCGFVLDQKFHHYSIDFEFPYLQVSNPTVVRDLAASYRERAD